MGIKKVYTANVFQDGKIIGAVMCRVWFWVSAYSAYDHLLMAAENINKNFVIADVRKL